MSKTSKKLMIVDGHALLHRAFYGFPPTMRTKSGEVVNAVYGFAMMFLKAIKNLRPDYVAVVFDTAEPNFRDKMFDKYKAQREKAPDELYGQIDRVQEVVRALNVPVYEKPGFEGDDLLATISDQFEKGKGNETYIVTGDLDALQLVDSQTRVFTSKRGLSDVMIYDEAAVMKRYGLKPSQMIDFKAMAGDSSDNIPGVKGVGEKTATDLLQTYKNLDSVYKEAKKPDSAIKPAVTKKLLADEKMAFLSKELVTIKRDVPGVKLDLNEATLADYDRDKVVKLFQELQFTSLLGKLPFNQNGDNGKATVSEAKVAKKPTRTCTLVDDAAKLAKFVSVLKKQKSFVYDVETKDLGALEYDLVGISFSWENGEAFYVVPFVKEVMSKLQKVFEDPQVKKAAHNIKYDNEAMLRAGVKVAGANDDTMIISYLLDPGTRAHSLEQIAFAELGYEIQPITDLIGKGKKQLTFDQVPIKKAAEYSCEDAEITWRLLKILRQDLKDLAVKQAKAKPYRSYSQVDGKPWDIEELYEKVEMPLVQVLIAMEKNGIKLNTNALKKSSKKMTKEIDKVKLAIFKIAGEEFNISSPAQLREVLFEKMKLPTDEIKKTKTGYSTAVGELMKLRKGNKIVEHIFKYREFTKLKNTYLDALPKLVNTKTGRLHTSFNQTITATGRLSSSNPNLQNIPVRTEEGQKIRQAFVSGKDYKFLSLDYSQIDLRVLAHFTEDKSLVKIFKDGGDIHAVVASKVFEVAADKVSANQRRIAKVVNFGIVYGMSAFGLAQTLQVERSEAQEYIDKYFTQHPQVKDYMKNIVDFAKKHGYVDTLFGRRRYLPEINSSQYLVRNSAERMAINMPIQGTSSDIVKLAMNAVAKQLESYGDDVRILLQVHDELLFEVKENKLQEVIPKITREMEGCCKLKVPLTVNAKTGDNWADMKEIKD